MPRTVLLVFRGYFDSLRIQGLLEGEGDGLTVISESHPITAYRKFEVQPPDLLILHHSVPDSDTERFIADIRDRRLPTRVIYFAADETPEAVLTPDVRVLAWESFADEPFLHAVREAVAAMERTAPHPPESADGEGAGPALGRMEELAAAGARTVTLLRCVFREGCPAAGIARAVKGLNRRLGAIGQAALDEESGRIDVRVDVPAGRFDPAAETAIQSMAGVLYKDFPGDFAVLRSAVGSADQVDALCRELERLEDVRFFCSEVPVLTATYLDIYRRPAGQSHTPPTQALLSALLAGRAETARAMIRDLYLLHIKPSMDRRVLGFHRGQFDNCLSLHASLTKRAGNGAPAGAWDHWTLEEEVEALAAHAERLAVEGTRGAGLSHPLVARCLVAIGEQYHRPISLNDLAGQLGTSKTHLSRVFKKEMGMGVVDYLHQVRMDAAEAMLQDAGAAIAVVAAACGFSDPQYFSRVFKSRHGVSPSEFAGGRAGEDAGCATSNY